MSISFYKQDANAGGSDFLTVAIWDHHTRPYYAEGGDTYQPGAPAADDGNTTLWGMNNQFRAIADGIIANYNARVTNAAGIATNVTNISSNDTDIATNASNIATNVTNISGNDTDIADHESRITTLEAAPTIAVWGNITGTLSSQTDLQAALDLKADDADVFKKDGLVTMTGDINLGGNGINQADFIATNGIDAYSGSDVNMNTDLDFVGTYDIKRLATLEISGSTPIIDAILDEDAMGTDSDTALATQQSIKKYVDDNAGGSPPNLPIIIPAADFVLQETNVPKFEEDSGSNGFMDSLRFDDTTEEFANKYIKIPNDINTAGTVTIYIIGYAATAVASKNVEFTLYHSAKNDGEDWDAAFSSKVSGDLACDATQDQIDVFSFTETVANLVWVANDLVRLKLSRTAPSANNLSGDYRLCVCVIDLPRA